MAVVTPWEVSGEINYQRLVREFGTKEIGPALLEKISSFSKNKLHPMLRRNFFFSHRDLDLVLNDYQSGKGFFLYTGRGPSGKMHIGHLIPFIFTKWLQEQFDVNLYIQITDDEKFLVKRQANWNDVEAYSKDNILDILAIGFDPEKTFVFRDSEYIRHMYPLVLDTAKRTTFSTAKAVFGFKNETNIGWIFYPSVQVVPTFFEKKRCLIPCAIDQDNYWRIQRDIAEPMGFKKASAIHSKFLPPLTGPQGKMSASDADTAVWLTDDEKTVKKKINKYAFSGGQATVEEHRDKGGNPDVDVSFQWLKILFEDDDKKLQKIENDYRSGKLLTGELKSILIEKINSFLSVHAKKREKAEKKTEKFMYSGKLAEKMWAK
ncbi:tryptophan--tRNA ligase [Candidatus Micrarchaeota archaeon]|nr:tryptophan--tRNA ligase [Candidatus Micrarchaeota archaeon]